MIGQIVQAAKRVTGARRLAGRAIGAAWLMTVAVALGLVGLTAFPAAGAQAAAREPGVIRSCPPDPWISVEYTGIHGYNSIGSAVGKHAASSGRLSYKMSVTKKRRTSWAIGGSATVSWGISQVEAHTSYSVTKVTRTGWTAQDTMYVPRHHYGYMEPKTEYREFHIMKEQYSGKCNVIVVKDYGVLKAITAYPFFSECVATNPCTPRP
jgi:hypothetical protein